MCVCVDQTVSSPNRKRTHHPLSSPCTPPPPPPQPCSAPMSACVCVCVVCEAHCVPEKLVTDQLLLGREGGFRIRPCFEEDPQVLVLTLIQRQERNASAAIWTPHRRQCSSLLSPLLPILRLLLSVSPLAPSLLQCSQNSLAQERPPSTVGRFWDFGVYLGDAGHGLKVLCAAKLEQHARARRGGRGRRDSVNSRSPRDRGECAHGSHLPITDGVICNALISACNYSQND